MCVQESCEASRIKRWHGSGIGVRFRVIKCPDAVLIAIGFDGSHVMDFFSRFDELSSTELFLESMIEVCFIYTENNRHDLLG